MTENLLPPAPEYRPTTEWLREGDLIYTLTPTGQYRKGEALMENHVTVRVSAHKGAVGPEQIEQIAAYVQAVLNQTMPATEDDS